MTTQHQKILNEFFNSNIKFISLDRLNQYISFCIDNNQNEKIKGETSYHHILPQAKDCFPEYKDLNTNKWNGTHLSYSDHYYAHWLLTEAIDSYSQLSAFCAMHNMDTKIGRIDESDLISPNKFQEKMELRSKHQKLFMQSEAGKEVTKKMKFTKNTKEWKDEVGKESTIKRLITLQIVQENGKTLAQNISINGAKTMSKKQENGLSIREESELKRQQTVNIVDKNGNSIASSATKNQSKTKNSKEWKESVGKDSKRKELETKSSEEWQENIWKPAMEKRSELIGSKEWKESVGEEAKLKGAFTKSNGKAFNIYNRHNEVLFSNIMSENIIKISKALRNATFDKPMGSNRLSKLGLNKLKKLHMIGMYVKEITLNSYKEINILESID
jgi:hypothetical protein